MGTAEHYDVVIIGRDLAGLLAAALLARRGRRVRVIFPDAPPDPVPRPPLFGLQAPVVQRGLDALGLVHATRTGRETRYVADPEPLDSVRTWVDETGAAWDRRLERLRGLL